MRTFLMNVKKVLSHYKGRSPFTFLMFCIRGLKILWFLPDHYELNRILKPFQDKGFIPVKISFIYLFKYLSKTFSTREKLTILTNHYSFLRRNFSDQTLKDIFGTGLWCWQQRIEEHSFEIRLTSPTPYEEEGSLSLAFRMDGNDIYSLGFTFVPGTHLELGEQQLIYISRIQGVNGRLDMISQASKIFSDNNPSTLLISAIEGIALSMGIKRIVGICAENQLGFLETRNNFNKTYNIFWETFEVTRLYDSDYSMAVPIKTKDLHFIKSRRRKRTIKKRIVRIDMSAKIYQNFRSISMDNNEWAITKELLPEAYGVFAFNS